MRVWRHGRKGCGEMTGRHRSLSSGHAAEVLGSACRPAVRDVSGSAHHVGLQDRRITRRTRALPSLGHL